MRRQPLVCSPSCCATSGASTASSCPTTSRCASSRLPPHRRRRRRRRGDRAARRARRRAARHRLLTPGRCWTPWRRGVVTIATSTEVAVGRVLTTKFRLGLFEQPYVESRRRAAVHTRPPPSSARDVAATASCCSRTTGSSRSSAPGSIAVIGPNADRARNLLGDYSYAAHVESLLEMHAIRTTSSTSPSPTNSISTSTSSGTGRCAAHFTRPFHWRSSTTLVAVRSSSPTGRGLQPNLVVLCSAPEPSYC